MLEDDPQIFLGKQGVSGLQIFDEEMHPSQKAEQWIRDIEEFQATLEEMAAASLDEDFKDELGAIDRWFGSLSNYERTAALYTYLYPAGNHQIKFFLPILRQIGQNCSYRSDMDAKSKQRLSDPNLCEIMLNEIATTFLDRDFKNEVDVVGQWFKILSAAERTAILYQLLQHIDKVQVVFFAELLQQTPQANMATHVSKASSGVNQGYNWVSAAFMNSAGVHPEAPKQHPSFEQNHKNRDSHGLDELGILTWPTTSDAQRLDPATPRTHIAGSRKPRKRRSKRGLLREVQTVPKSGTLAQDFSTLEQKFSIKTTSTARVDIGRAHSRYRGTTSSQDIASSQIRHIEDHAVLQTYSHAPIPTFEYPISPRVSEHLGKHCNISSSKQHTVFAVLDELKYRRGTEDA
jgi:hypothetical protein